MEEQVRGAPQPDEISAQELIFEGLAARRPSVRQRAQRLWRRHPTMVGAMVFVTLMILMAILAPVLFTDNPREVKPSIRILGPSSEHWFGTDFLGRDVYSRTVYGARISLIVGASVGAIVSVTASIIGLFAGYFRRFDMIVMRIMDGIMSIPDILLAIALVSIAGGSVQNVIMALSVVSAPRGVRVVRSSVLSLREEVYVEAARAIGAKTPRILFLHVFPGTIAPLIVLATIIGAAAILVEAILSFLGAGTPPEIPSWGTMMAEGKRTISQAMWVLGFPGMFLTATVLAINVIGDNLRDILDPKLSRSEA